MEETTKENTEQKTEEVKPKSSKYIGVSYITRAKKYLASVRVGGQRIIAGYFTDEYEAAVARDEAARKAGADESRMNFPKNVETTVEESGDGTESANEETAAVLDDSVATDNSGTDGSAE